MTNGNIYHYIGNSSSVHLSNLSQPLDQCQPPTTPSNSAAGQPASPSAFVRVQQVDKACYVSPASVCVAGGGGG